MKGPKYLLLIWSFFAEVNVNWLKSRKSVKRSFTLKEILTIHALYACRISMECADEASCYGQKQKHSVNCEWVTLLKTFFLLIQRPFKLCIWCKSLLLFRHLHQNLNLNKFYTFVVNLKYSSLNQTWILKSKTFFFKNRLVKCKNVRTRSISDAMVVETSMLLRH